MLTGAFSEKLASSILSQAAPHKDVGRWLARTDITHTRHGGDGQVTRTDSAGTKLALFNALAALASTRTLALTCPDSSRQ